LGSASAAKTTAETSSASAGRAVERGIGQAASR
jgi:hypothetical protein